MSVPRLWLCADLGHPAGASLLPRVTRALEAGPAAVWLRAPTEVPARDLLAVARALRAVTRAAGSALFVGDRVDVALAAGADGVHLPERSFDPADLASIPLRRSRAAHDLAGVRARAGAVDAVVASPWGAVPGKGAPLGDAGLRALVDAAGRCPVVALGGIAGADEARRCLAAGAAGVAVRRALLEVDDPLPACAALHRALSLLTVDGNP